MVASVLRKIKHKTLIRTRLKKVEKKARVAAQIYRNDGARELTIRTKDAIKRRVKRRTAPKSKKAGDVLMVSIDEPLLDRYRTDHMIESLRSTGTSVDKVFYYELTAEHAKHYNTFIFYRVPWVDEFEKFFADVRKKNKVAVYAVDDLVIDTKYTNQIPVVQQMAPGDRAIYDDGVERHKKVMEYCDYAITTTDTLAEELRGYKNLKEVFIDRNSMSDEMVHYANKAVDEVERDAGKVVIGYFSGTNTHNEDFQMVAPALVRLMRENEKVYVKLAGRIDPPEALKDYADRLIYTPYVDWRKLPFELRKCDIVLAPLVDTLFNRAKSEIKWSESALVGVPVVASDMGSFRDIVKNNHTGVLVKNTPDAWYEGVRRLVDDEKLRHDVGIESRQYVLAHCRTTGERAVSLRKFVDRITPKVVAFGGVSIGAISGGNMVVKKHMDLLRGAGYIVYGVESMDYSQRDKWEQLNKQDDKEYDIFRINSKRPADKIDLSMHFDRYVATFWASMDMVDEYRYMKNDGKKLYLVQNMEADFYPLNDKLRLKVLATYRNKRIEPITISKWCQQWLGNDFGHKAKYAPNGIDIEKYPYHERNWSNRKIKVLIEGDSASEYKRVDESFKVANKLDRTKYEVSYMSYNATPKEWYKVDHTYMKVPYSKVGKVYADHDILIKSSILESFSYPPLEMMATGGYVVVVPNDGNTEYLEDGVNCLFYERGNIDDALERIDELTNTPSLQKKLRKNGLTTAKSRNWGVVTKNIVELYQ